MSKSVVAFAFLPLLAACAGTPSEGVKTAQNCKMVSGEDTGSNIKVRRECASTPNGGSPETASKSEAVPAPQ